MRAEPEALRDRGVSLRLPRGVWERVEPAVVAGITAGVPPELPARTAPPTSPSPECGHAAVSLRTRGSVPVCAVAGGDVSRPRGRPLRPAGRAVVLVGGRKIAVPDPPAPQFGG
ncbi:hypothetical protein GCM10010195_73410 [Kitasatospora griseola]|nr:hypothetical protein GCM10010195_73410 [Kitasatospora griseola]